MSSREAISEGDIYKIDDLALTVVHAPKFVRLMQFLLQNNFPVDIAKKKLILEGSPASFGLFCNPSLIFVFLIETVVNNENNL